jgi:aspartate/methionine/tyrosine aminotransferase
MKIAEFEVERWMDLYENRCRYNLAETCVQSLRVDELLALSGKGAELFDELKSLKLTYGAIQGTERLRSLIAGLYATKSRDQVLITHGAAGANALVYETLVEPGDQIVSFTPAYQQHVSIAESYGAEVRQLRLREENGFLPDLDELRRLMTARTRLIVLSNPNNPTGSLMDRAALEAIARIAADWGAYVLGDEVYRGSDQEGDGYTASIADLYERGISTGSMSKAYSLAGLRLGWIVAREALLREVGTHRDYNTISVGMIDDFLASLALENRAALLRRNHAIVRGNLALLDAWLRKQPLLSYVKPRSGTTALLKYGQMESREFCVNLIEATGVMLTPGSAMDMEGYVRMGYANDRSILSAGLDRMAEFLASSQQRMAAKPLEISPPGS